MKRNPRNKAFLMDKLPKSLYNINVNCIKDFQGLVAQLVRASALHAEG